MRLKSGIGVEREDEEKQDHMIWERKTDMLRERFQRIGINSAKRHGKNPPVAKRVLKWER